jgi:deoxyribonuclease V
LAYVGGVDISFVKDTTAAVASIVVMSFPDLRVVRSVMHHCHMPEPYMPGFLAFRELPPVLEALSKLRQQSPPEEMPQLLLLDGNGVHHMRRCGLATHLGVTCGIPTIGCAKKFLSVDGLTREVAQARFAAHLAAGGGTVMALFGSSGQLWSYMALTGKSTVRPVYISPGHMISFRSATALVLLMTRNKVVEPVRQADLQSRAYIRENMALLLPHSASCPARRPKEVGDSGSDSDMHELGDDLEKKRP